MSIKTLTIVGVGLIGGSIGLAAKSRGVAKRVLGVGRHPASLDRACAMRAIDEGLLDVGAAVSQADVAVFGTPVNCIADQVLSAAPACAPGTLLTDAGSTKAEILKAVEGRLPAGVHFVGSHPLAGSEKRGPEHADADLFHDRLVVVTQTPLTDAAALERSAAFWRSLGARVKIMDAEEHDRALALTSHVPHLVAAALTDILPRDLYELTATGFRDTTRIAAGDPGLWTAIFSQNRDGVLAGLERLVRQLELLQGALGRSDWEYVQGFLTQAKKARDALGS